MNLHAIVGPVIAAVNPMVTASLYVSAGNTTSDDGTLVPSYLPVIPVQAQVQALTFRDIQQVNALNLQGTRRGIYLFGDVEGLVRPDNKGGDLIVLPDGSVWLVAITLEKWDEGATGPNWCKVAATLQNDAPITIVPPPIYPNGTTLPNVGGPPVTSAPTVLTAPFILVNTSTNPQTYPLPTDPEMFQSVTLKDSGNASVNHITVTTSDGSLIDGHSSYVIEENNASYQFVWGGTGWSVI